MKTLVLILTIAFTNLLAQAQEQKEGVNITVTVDNALNDKGQMIIALHKQNTFLKGVGIQNKIEKITNGKVTTIFKNVPKGEYAILVLHDENKNRQIDFEGGRPKEAYGSSGNDMSFGPPSYEFSKFNVGTEPIQMRIRL